MSKSTHIISHERALPQPLRLWQGEGRRNQMDVRFMGWLNGLEEGKWMSQGCQLIRKRPLVNLEFYKLNQN